MSAKLLKYYYLQNAFRCFYSSYLYPKFCKNFSITCNQVCVQTDQRTNGVESITFVAQVVMLFVMLNTYILYLQAFCHWTCPVFIDAIQFCLLSRSLAVNNSFCIFFASASPMTFPYVCQAFSSIYSPFNCFLFRYLFFILNFFITFRTFFFLTINA